MFILGFILVLVFFVFLANIFNGDIRHFLDFWSMGMVLLPLLAVLITTNSLKAFCGGLMAVVLNKKTIPKKLQEQSIALFRLLTKATAIISVIGFLIQLIITLRVVDIYDPAVYPKIAPNIAMFLVVVLYGLFLIVAVFEPAVYCLKRYDAD